MGDQRRLRNHRDEDDSEPEMMKVNMFFKHFKDNFYSPAAKLNYSVSSSHQFGLKQCE